MFIVTEYAALKGWTSIIFIGWVCFHLDLAYRVSPVILLFY